MKTAAHLFYLAVYSLLSPAHTSSSTASPRLPAQDVCAINPKAIVSDACASYSTLEKLNSDLTPILTSITKETDFFAYYRLNLFNKECPFWNDANSMCGNIACAVTTLDNEEDVPAIWRAEELSKLEGPKAEHPGKKLQKERSPQRPLQGELGADVGESCVLEYDDECDQRDYCVPEDESADGKGDYVSLVDNPERFTGYSGEGAAMVWNAIYRENCFSKSSFPAHAALGKSSTPDNLAASKLKSVLFKPPTGGFQSDLGFENEDECLEKRVFYRVISGMHASISTHICAEYLNQTTGLWSPNLQCYKERLHQHPERVANLYFNYALVVRAIAKLGPYLRSYTFCSGDVEQDRATKEKVQLLTDRASSGPQIFDESQMFVNGEGPSLKEDFKVRFRNVSRLMDCVGCDKCRLWGKVQTNGYGAALKVLFEFNERENSVAEYKPQLKRTELVALFNTLARISSSLSAVEKFRSMLEEEEGHSLGHADRHVHHISDRERLPHHVVFGEEKEKALKDKADRDAVRAEGKKAVERSADSEAEVEESNDRAERTDATIIDEVKEQIENLSESVPTDEKSVETPSEKKDVEKDKTEDPLSDETEKDIESSSGEQKELEKEAEEEEEEEEDDDEDDELREVREALANAHAQPLNASTGAMFKQEIIVVYHVFIYILKSYVRLPGVLWHIFLIEASRLWERFVGLPLTERGWAWVGRRPINEL